MIWYFHSFWDSNWKEIVGKTFFEDKSKNHKEMLTYRKSGAQDLKVEVETQDSSVESLGGTLRWDPKMGS